MASILIYSNNHKLIDKCSRALATNHIIKHIGKISPECSADIIIIDTHLVDNDSQLLSLFKKHQSHILLAGSQWSEEKLVDAMLNGASGYYDEAETDIMLSRAVENILQGDIWVQRHLVPKVIDALINAQHPDIQSQQPYLSKEILNTLSSRERDVANLVSTGKSNKQIAQGLDISERTVKAHLTSVFKKLNVTDRLHLALLLKESA